MELSDDELKHIETLARIRLSGESREKLREQLARIIDFVRRLQEIDTSNYAPGARTGGFDPYIRDDIPEPCLPRKEVLAESPESENGLFSVPKVIESEES